MRGWTPGIHARAAHRSRRHHPRARPPISGRHLTDHPLLLGPEPTVTADVTAVRRAGHRAARRVPAAPPRLVTQDDRGVGGGGAKRQLLSRALGAARAGSLRQRCGRALTPDVTGVGALVSTRSGAGAHRDSRAGAAVADCAVTPDATRGSRLRRGAPAR